MVGRAVTWERHGTGAGSRLLFEPSALALVVGPHVVPRAPNLVLHHKLHKLDALLAQHQATPRVVDVLLCAHLC